MKEKMKINNKGSKVHFVLIIIHNLIQVEMNLVSCFIKLAAITWLRNLGVENGNPECSLYNVHAF